MKFKSFFVILVICAAFSNSFLVKMSSSSQWSISTVDGSNTNCFYTSIALDSQEYVHISYHDDIGGTLKYAYQGPNGWVTKVIDNSEEVGRHTSLALDNNDNPHISYSDIIGHLPENDHLFYAYQRNNEWTIEVVDSCQSGVKDTSLVLDSKGMAHIGYVGWGDIKYAYQTSSGWDITTLDTLQFDSEDIALALDSQEYPHLVYSSESVLKHAYQNSTGWHNENIVFLNSSGFFVIDFSLKIAADDKVHISYNDYTSKDLMYITKGNDSEWISEVVDSFDEVGTYNSLELDKNGKVHISYNDYTNHDLKYAYQTNESWAVETVSNEGYVGLYTSLTLDKEGYAHISYLGGAGFLGSLQYATNNPKGIVFPSSNRSFISGFEIITTIGLIAIYTKKKTD
ncbi:MAG: hypothetical protein ACFFDT_13540 [Candidatus Hodarchaeota archaeon]